MNGPEEIERINKEVITKETVITPSKDIAQLSDSDEQCHSLIFELTDTQDITKIAHIISKNQKTLRHLVVKRLFSQRAILPWNKTKELAQAIAGCQELRVLCIENFKGIFDEAVKYLVSAIQHLKHLQHLSFKNTHIFPLYLWDFFIECLSKVDALLTLNLENSIILGNAQFSRLNAYLAENTTLTELNLGRSPICTDGLVTLKVGAEKNKDSAPGLHFIFSKIYEVNDITKVTQLIIKNQKTLRHLTLNGHTKVLQSSTITWGQTKELAHAIAGCQELRTLQLKYFKGVFNESIKYLITVIQKLKNLQHLSFENTYLAPYWELFTETLGQLKHLLTLNIDCSAILSNEEFSFLGSLIAKSSSLTVLNLGLSPIWLDGLETFAWGFAKTENNNLELIWEPHVYIASESLYWHLSMAVNWQCLPAVDSLAKSKIKVLNEGQHDPFNLHCFSISEKKLAELQDILARRRNRETVTKLKFQIQKFEFLDLSLMLTKIASNIATVQELEIQVEFILSKGSHPSYWPLLVKQLAKLLMQASNLHTVKLINFQTLFLQDDCIVIAALASLPQLKSLALSGTYLREIGAEHLAQILQRNILGELEIASTLITDACFTRLMNGLRQCHSLRRVTLGDSPMTGAWLKMLLTAQTQIVWQSGSISVMAKKFEIICDQLSLVDRELDTEALKNNFRNQDPNELKNQIAALKYLQHEDDSNQNIPKREGFFASLFSFKRSEGTNLEMQTIKRGSQLYGATD